MKNSNLFAAAVICAVTLTAALTVNSKPTREAALRERSVASVPARASSVPNFSCAASLRCASKGTYGFRARVPAWAVIGGPVVPVGGQ